MLLSDGFLQTARERLSKSAGTTEADLRRAYSDLYYVLFHQVCETLVLTVHLDDRAVTKEVWTRLYRLPDHALIAKACDDGRVLDFPRTLQQFAALYKALKQLRESADYDASAQFKTSDVRNALSQVETVIRAYREQVALETRITFCMFLAIRKRA